MLLEVLMKTNYCCALLKTPNNLKTQDNYIKITTEEWRGEEDTSIRRNQHMDNSVGQGRQIIFSHESP